MLFVSVCNVSMFNTDFSMWESVCVGLYLKFALQSGGGAVSAALVHHHHHVGQRVHPHLLQLQVLLQELQHTRGKTNSTHTGFRDGGFMTEFGWKQQKLNMGFL